MKTLFAEIATAALRGKKTPSLAHRMSLIHQHPTPRNARTIINHHDHHRSVERERAQYESLKLSLELHERRTQRGFEILEAHIARLGAKVSDLETRARYVYEKPPGATMEAGRAAGAGSGYADGRPVPYIPFYLRERWLRDNNDVEY